MNENRPRLFWSDFVYELAELLRASVTHTAVYLVGGAVRDAYLRVPITDIDLAIDGDAVSLARQLADKLGGEIYVMDREREVARVFIRHDGAAICIDVARFRGATLAADLRDRDFTINAMAADLLGDIETVIDPLGGVKDLQRRVLRRCSPDGIAADPIRVLRAVRLCAQFNLKLEPATAADCRCHATELARISRERIRDEFFKLLGLDRAARGLRVLQHLGALAAILPAVAALESKALAPARNRDAWSFTLTVVERLSAILQSISSRRTDNTAAAFGLGTLVIQLDRFRPLLQKHLTQEYGNGRNREQLLLLSALLHSEDEMERAVDVAAFGKQNATSSWKGLRLSSVEGRLIETAINNYRRVIEPEAWTTLDQHRFWFELGDSGIDAVLLGVAHVLGRQGRNLKQPEWLRLVEAVTMLLDVYFNRQDDIVSPRLLLDGRDICRLLGIEPGPAVGRTLTALREAQVTGDVGTESEARAFVRERADALVG